jgi:mono/diheme cytochrome c family protein
MSKFCLIIVFICFTAIVAHSQTSSSSATSGKELYTQYCLACHQEDGAGVPNLNPPLIQTSYVVGDKKKLITWVLKGSGDEKVPIDGNYYNNNMPSQVALKDDEIAKILTYVRSHFGNKASAISATEVKAVRATVK